MRLDKKYRTLFEKYEITTPLRKAHILAQLDAETGMKPREENLMYSSKRLMEVFPKYFRDVNPKEYEYKPEKIANRVYANRMGNGDEKSGDGWKYRGRGFMQITGKNNYRKLSQYTGVDYINNPDLLLTEADSVISALWYWKVNNINKYADKDDIDKVSDIINIGRPTEKYGDSHGFDKRVKFLKEWKKEFGI